MVNIKKAFNKLIASPRNSHRNVPAQRTEQSNIALAILESQIEAEKLRTEEAKAEQARIQSLAASAERRTSVRKDKSTNEMPRSPYQTTTKEKKIPSNNSSDGFNAFRCPPIQTQTREIQTIDTQKQSTLTQTNDDFSSQNDSSNSYSSTENISEKKRGSVKFPPRFQPPFDIYDNHDTPKSSIITTPSLTIEKKSYETETNMYEKFDLIKKEQQKEAEERRKKEEKQFEELKKLIQSNPVEATKMPKLSASSSFHPYALSTSTKVQGKSNSVFAEKTSETQRDSQAINSKQGNIQQDSVSNQPIKLVENQMLGTIDVIIENTNDSKNIAVIGLPKTGRSTLVGALAGGIWPKNLSQNPVNTKYGKIYKLNYPNNGFIDGSVNENRPIYEEFFQNAKLSNLSTLIITIDGSVREEDYLVLSLAQKYCIPTVIARTKLDEWLDNRPKDQSKEDYVKNDKKFVIESLQKLGINFSQNNIFNISALSTIIIAEEGSQSDMFKYLQDDDALLETLNKLIASPRNSHRNVPAQRTEQRNIALAILESQIEAEKLRTEEAEAEQARIQSLAASAERRTSIRKDKSTNEMPRSPYQLQSFGNQKNKQNTVVDADIVVLGMKDSGKSGIIEALRQSLNWSKRDKIIVEIGYDETMSRDYVISMIDRSNPKLCILIISNTIGRLDAEVARYVINSKKRLCVSLNKSDEIIYNLEKQHSFYGNQDYTRKRLEAANNEFKKVNIFNLPCFTTSALVLAGILNNTYATQEREFLTFVETNLKNM